MTKNNGIDNTESVKHRFKYFGMSLQEAIVAKAPKDAVSMHINMLLQNCVEFEVKGEKAPFGF